MRKVQLSGACAVVAVVAILDCAPVHAQQAPAPASAQPAPASTGNDIFGDIVVTARKREETVQNTPVAVTAFGKEFINTYNIESVSSVASFTPGLVVGDGNTGAGGTIYLRGVGSNIDSPLVDQAVAVNVDGVQVGGQVLRASTFDLGQIEVLRGPQALFFGKNSPGGVVAMTSSKPTDHLYVKATAGYEFEARERYFEGIISGPLTDTLGARIAVRKSVMDGYFKLVGINAGGAVAPPRDRGPDANEFDLKGALQFKPGSRFDAILNLSYSKYKADTGVLLQRTACPAGGVAQTTNPIFATVDDCKVNGTLVLGAIPAAALAQMNPYYTHNQPLGFIDSTQYLAGLTANYRLADKLKLTSVTGYYEGDDKTFTNFSVEPDLLTADSPFVRLRQFTEEMRLASSYGQVFDFVLGAYFEKSKTLTQFDLEYAFGPIGLLESADQDRTVYSGFGQAILRPISHVEITGGVRYTHDKKDVNFTSSAIPGVVGKQNPSFNNVSPEATIQYKPSDHLNIYGSYKKGFLPGGVNSGTSVITSFVASGGTLPITYSQEQVHGFEAGVKFSSDDNRFRGSVAAFTYNYSGLQLQAVDPTSNFTILVQNAGAARVRGIEGDFNYRPPVVDGLVVFGNAAYLNARYTDFISDCYTGQSISQGCNLGFNATQGRYLKQNLDGTALKTAPDWSGTIGFDYSLPTRGFKLDIGSNIFYSSKTRVDNVNNPLNLQPSYTKVNASVKLSSPDDRWQLALIGENLNNVFVVTAANQDFVSGSALASPAGTPIAYKADQFGNVERGRIVRLQLTYELK